MLFNHYVIIKNTEELDYLFLILSVYLIETKSILERIFYEIHSNYLSNKRNVMVCIEKTRISFNRIEYNQYRKSKNLVQITLSEIIEKW